MASLRQGHVYSKEETTTIGSTTSKGTRWEYTRETEKQCSHQTTASSLHVQHLWTDLTTTEEQLFTENTSNPLYWRTNTKHWQKNKGTENLQEAFGKEKHGSGYFLNKRKVQRGFNRSNHKTNKALAHQCLRGIQASNLRKRQQFHHQRKYNVQQITGSEIEDTGKEYMWFPEQNSTYQHLKTTEQTSTSFYQHGTRTYTQRTTSGELKTTGQLNHNLQGKNSAQDPQPLKKAWSTVRTCSLKMTHPRWQHDTSKGNDNAYTTNTTGNTGTQHHTHAIQNLVSNICTSKRQASKPSKPDIAAANLTSWFHLHHKFRWQVPNTDTYSDRHTNRHGNGSSDYRQAQPVQLCKNLPTSIPSGVWPDRRHFTSDNEEYLIALLRATANACGNMAVRFSPAYSSQSNGNVERYYRTQSGQIRTLREQVQQNHSIQIPTDHPLMAIAVRHSAYLINRFLIKADGCTSYQARWGRTHNAALC